MTDNVADTRRDLDETRRLAYIAQAAARIERHHDLVGTLTNALAHHGLGADPVNAMTQLCKLVEPGITNDGAAAQRKAQAWIEGVIRDLTERAERLAGD